MKVKVISGFFRREVGENRGLLGYYSASSGNFLSTFRDNLSVSFSRGRESTRCVITQNSAVLNVKVSNCTSHCRNAPSGKKTFFSKLVDLKQQCMTHTDCCATLHALPGVSCCSTFGGVFQCVSISVTNFFFSQLVSDSMTHTRLYHSFETPSKLGEGSVFTLLPACREGCVHTVHTSSDLRIGGCDGVRRFIPSDDPLVHRREIWFPHFRHSKMYVSACPLRGNIVKFELIIINP